MGKGGPILDLCSVVAPPCPRDGRGKIGVGTAAQALCHIAGIPAAFAHPVSLHATKARSRMGALCLRYFGLSP
jgi:hypothetical protein